MNKKGQALVEFIIILPVIIFIIMLLVDFMTIFSYKNKLESNMNNVTILYKENKIDEINQITNSNNKITVVNPATACPEKYI